MKKNCYISRWAIVSFICGHITYAHAFDLKPYIGVDYVQRALNFQDGYGKGNFNKSLPQGNLCLGFQLTNYFGVEFGYLASQYSTRTSFATNQQSMGLPIPDTGYLISESKIKLAGPYINLVARLKLYDSNFYGITSFGIARTTLKARYKQLGSDRLAIFDEADIKKNERYFSSSKSLYRIMMGIEYAYNKRLSLRAQTGYETSGRFKNMIPNGTPTRIRLTLKNSALFSFGAIIRF